jgi:hypothetical protein
MSEHQRALSGAPTSSVSNMVCLGARRPGCSLRAAALDTGSGRNGVKDSLTACEIEIFLSLVRGDRVAVRDHETGALWHGWVDVPFPDHGFVWVITDVGERQLLDIGVHTVWRPEEPCGSLLREACSRDDDRDFRAAPLSGQNPSHEPLEPG